VGIQQKASALVICAFLLLQMFRVQLYDRAKALQEAVQDVKAAAGDPSLLDGNTGGLHITYCDTFAHS
jgi:hypothetical protein